MQLDLAETRHVAMHSGTRVAEGPQATEVGTHN